MFMLCVGEWWLGSPTMYLGSGSRCVSSMLTLHADFYYRKHALMIFIILADIYFEYL